MRLPSGSIVQSGTKSQSLIRRCAPRHHGLADRGDGTIAFPSMTGTRRRDGPAGMVLNTPIANSADLAGDQAVIARAEAIRPDVAAASDDIEARAGCRPRCSTSCTTRSCSGCCCPARPTGSKPIPSLFSTSSKPSPRLMLPPPGASARPAVARCRRPISTCRWRRRSSAIRARCWRGGPAPGFARSNATAATG